jgi:predicted peptidase
MMTGADRRPKNLLLKSFHSTLTHTPRQYWLYLPRAYCAGDRRWPVMLFLHGGGERCEDPEHGLEHGPTKEVANGRDLPFLILAPQMPSRAPSAQPSRRPEPWPAGKRKSMLRETPGVEHPWAAVAPICGVGELDQVHNIGTTPVWVFQGGRDDLVRPEWTLATAEALDQAGGNVRVTVHKDLPHDCWTRVYGGQDLYDWFLSQSRAG